MTIEHATDPRPPQNNQAGQPQPGLPDDWRWEAPAPDDDDAEEEAGYGYGV